MNPQLARAKATQTVPGLRVPGNINLNGRPLVANSDGSYSSELSFSRGTGEGEVLVPRIVNGQLLSEDEAWNHYRKTGEHMGIFDTPDHADAYATEVHNRAPKTAAGTPNYEANAAIRPPIEPIQIPEELKGQRK